MLSDTIDLGDYKFIVSNFEKKEEPFVEIQEEGQYDSIIQNIKYNIQPMCLNKTLFPHEKEQISAYLDASLKAIAIDSIMCGKGFEFLKRVLYFDEKTKCFFFIFNAHLYKIDQFEMSSEQNKFYIKTSETARLIMKDLQLSRVYLFVDLAPFNPPIPNYKQPPMNEYFFGYQIMEFNKVIYKLREFNPGRNIPLCSELNSQVMKKYDYCIEYLQSFLDGKKKKDNKVKGKEIKDYLIQIYKKEYKIEEVNESNQAKRLISEIKDDKELQSNFINNFCVSPNYLTTLCLSLRALAQGQDFNQDDQIEDSLYSAWCIFKGVYDYEHREKRHRCRDKFGNQIETNMRLFIFGEWQEKYAADAFLFGQSQWIYLIDTITKLPFKTM